MKKSLLFASLLALTTATASAQHATSFAIPATKALGLLEKATVTPMTQASAKAKKAAPRKIALPDNQRVVGYYNTDEVNNALGLGSITTSDIQPVMIFSKQQLRRIAHLSESALHHLVDSQLRSTSESVFDASQDAP